MIENEVITLTNSQIKKCYSDINKAEKSGIKATWIISANFKKLIDAGVKATEISANTNYSKSSVSKLFRAANLMECFDYDLRNSIAEKYGATSVCELLTLNFENAENIAKQLVCNEKIYTQKEIRELCSNVLLDVATEAEAEAEAGTEEGTGKVDKKMEFIEKLISYYNISEKDAEKLRKFCK